MPTETAAPRLLLALLLLAQGRPAATHLHFHLAEGVAPRDLHSLFNSLQPLAADDGLSAIGQSLIRAAEPVKGAVRGEVPASWKHAGKAARLSRGRRQAARRQPSSHKHVFDVMNEMVSKYEGLTPDEKQEVQTLVANWKQTGRAPSVSDLPQPLVKKAVGASVNAVRGYYNRSSA